MSDDEILEAWGKWVTDTCLLFGCKPETAFKASALFCEGLRTEWQENANGNE